MRAPARGHYHIREMRPRPDHSDDPPQLMEIFFGFEPGSGLEMEVEVQLRGAVRSRQKYLLTVIICAGPRSGV